MSKPSDSEMLLGIDYGDANIGLAIGRGDLVNPLHVIKNTNEIDSVKEINRFVIQNKIDRLIVGLPLGVDGKETPQARKVRKFAKLLKIRTKRPVEFVNEFLSTQNAIRESVELGMPKRSRSKVDHLSAALILKNYEPS